MNPDRPRLIGAVLKEHELRRGLVAEIHARPFERLSAPLRASHLLMFGGDPERDQAAVAALCRHHYGLPEPDLRHRHLSVDVGDGLRIKWERHTEFSSFTVFETGPFAHPFDDPVIERLPRDWLADLPGKVLSALHVAVDDKATPRRSVDELSVLFGFNTITGSAVSDGRAHAYTDQKIHDDGFGRALVCDVDLNSRSTGRVVQRLIEIHDYRIMAMLGLPMARQCAAEIDEVYRRLNEVTQHITRIGDIEEERKLLHQITELAAHTERIAGIGSYRFNASRAYFAIVNERIAQMRESRIAGLQSFESFHARRLAPAMATCESVTARLSDLSERVGRASDLLRTRVDVALEGQNVELLASMNRRAKLQLRLQETVEGLSVVVLTYYLVGLIGYMLKGLKAGGAAIDTSLLTGIAAPLVFVIVFVGLRRMRKRVSGDP